MENKINILIVSCSVLISLIGLFFVLKIWLVWNKIDMSVLKARVFLDSNFLTKNWIFVFMAGALITIRRVVQLLELLESPLISTPVKIISDLIGLAIIILLVLLAYYWYRLVYSTIK